MIVVGAGNQPTFTGAREKELGSKASWIPETREAQRCILLTIFVIQGQSCVLVAEKKSLEKYIFNRKSAFRFYPRILRKHLHCSLLWINMNIVFAVSQLVDMHSWLRLGVRHCAGTICDSKMTSSKSKLDTVHIVTMYM